MKVKIALQWLSGCEGCEVALLDSFNLLLGKIQRGEAEIVYAPLLLDIEDYDCADTTIVTGSIRTAADERRVKKAREKSGALIAFGSCACFGGIHGLADLADIGAVGEKTGRIPSETRLKEAVDPVWRVVKTDAAIPGCPPPRHMIDNFLENMLSPSTADHGKTVCDECLRRRSEDRKITGLRRDLTGVDDSRCLLDQGIPCIGFAVSSGCGALCPKVNYPCHGCMGFSEDIEGQDRGVARAVSALASILEPDVVEESLKDPVGFFMKFTYPSFKLRRKR